jgi:lipoate-protein ligase A
VLALPQAARDALRVTLRQRAIALDRALGRAVSLDEAADALARGFSRALHLTLAPGELTEDEQAALVPLRAKHAQNRWLFER